MDQQSRTAKPERNTHVYCQLAYEKGAKNIQWGKDKLVKNGTGKTGQSYEKMELYPCLFQAQK